jgi:uncharacterized surface protein with fasciclin (FAS1) repeats
MTTYGTPAKQLDILETTVASGSFNHLAAALEATGLSAVLKGPGPFTIFAPGDRAFSGLASGTLETLLAAENKQKLVSILAYHLVPARLTALELIRLEVARTVNGESIKIDIHSDGVWINQAKVISADILCSNGVIHAIDSVLIPE